VIPVGWWWHKLRVEVLAVIAELAVVEMAAPRSGAGAGGRSAAELRYGAVEVRMTADMSGDPGFNDAIDALGDEVAGMLLDATDEAALMAAMSGMDMASLLAGGLDAEAEAKLAESLFSAIGGAGAGGVGSAGLAALSRIPPDAAPPTLRAHTAHPPPAAVAPPAGLSEGARTPSVTHLEVHVPLTGATYPVAVTRLPKAMHVWLGAASAPGHASRSVAPAPDASASTDKLYRIAAVHDGRPAAAAGAAVTTAAARTAQRSQPQLPLWGSSDVAVATPPTAEVAGKSQSVTTLHLPASGGIPVPGDGVGADGGALEAGFDPAAVSQRLARRCGVMVLLSHALPADTNTPFVVAHLVKAVEAWWSDAQQHASSGAGELGAVGGGVAASGNQFRQPVSRGL